MVQVLPLNPLAGPMNYLICRDANNKEFKGCFPPLRNASTFSYWYLPLSVTQKVTKFQPQPCPKPRSFFAQSEDSPYPMHLGCSLFLIDSCSSIAPSYFYCYCPPPPICFRFGYP